MGRSSSSRNKLKMKKLKEMGLDIDPSLVDANHLLMKSEGGKYTEANIEILNPVEHQILHENLRERTPEMEELMALVGSYRQVIKILVKLENQKWADKRGVDKLHPADLSLYEVVKTVTTPAKEERVKKIEKWLKEHSNPLIKAMLSVKGIGPITVAELLVDIDFAKADHPSSLWEYVGYGKSSLDRYQKGVKGGGNKGLRTVLYNMAGSFLISKSPYTEIYYNTKKRLEVSEKITRERDNGKIIEVKWKEGTLYHRHMTAIRAMNKYYLADLWWVGRTYYGLPVNDLYVKEHLGHESAIINPEKMGWKLDGIKSKEISESST